MTHPRSQDDSNGTGEQPARREWVRPTVRRMSAGSAEDGAISHPDSGINPS
ncbi:MAG TPA: hypothetical protein VF693_03565 [Allosphingosinicella sp.]|jgi:hypothetical protein